MANTINFVIDKKGIISPIFPDTYVHKKSRKYTVYFKPAIKEKDFLKVLLNCFPEVEIAYSIPYRKECIKLPKNSRKFKELLKGNERKN